MTDMIRYRTSSIDGPLPADALTVEGQIGHCCKLACYSAVHSSMGIKAFIEHLSAPIALNQIKLYFNRFGQCVGYVVWAYLSPRTEKRLLTEPDYRLKDYEWSEGQSLWIVDFLVPHGSLDLVLVDFRDNLFAKDKSVTYFRLKSRKRIAKQLSRQDSCSFFKK
ncbi:toxin-activating lysine-acyltransferase [Asticcacaulis sp.]|uniref:toxin-activating lysine-acyltransferase n=1 Tax=Asticcacaulis sp. TaxID=1872648 RepID=UPI00261C7675|nr:toxin-activating lysine-acyltransferase [Asticcacaulis sp.]